MISIDDLSPKFENDLYYLCENSPYGARVISYHTAYHGKKYLFLDFWIQYDKSGEPVCSFCKFYTTLIICGFPEKSSNSELNEFIKMISPANILCDARFNITCNYKTATGETMRCRKLKTDLVSPVRIFSAGSSMKSLRAVYTLLTEADNQSLLPGFDDYFIDISHRIRHGTAEVYVIKDDSGKYISTAAVLAKSDTAAVAGCVATDKRHRNKGLASALVSYIARQQLSENRIVFLHREKPIAMYEKIGFEVTGWWKELAVPIFFNHGLTDKSSNSKIHSSS